MLRRLICEITSHIEGNYDNEYTQFTFFDRATKFPLTLPILIAPTQI